MAEQHDLSEYNGGSLVASACTFLFLSWVSVFLRSYVRLFMTNGFQMDDWFMLLGQIVFTLSCSFILLGVGQGLGRHNAALSEDVEIESLKWQALATATYVLDMALIKISIGVFLLRLAAGKNVYKYILWGSLFVVTIWSLVSFFWNMFQCSPVEAQWDYRIPDLKCVGPEEIVNAAYALSVMTILSDWLYALLPIPMLWNVAMTVQTKITVMVILGLGIFASIATLIRLKFLADLENLEDILFAGTDAMVWTLIEPGVAIVAASLATIRPLLRALRFKGFETSGRSRGKSGGLSGGMRSGTTPSAPHSGILRSVDIEQQISISKSDQELELGSVHVNEVYASRHHPRFNNHGHGHGQDHNNYSSNHGHGHGGNSSGNTLTVSSEPRKLQKSQRPGAGRGSGGGRRADRGKSEMYVIEGDRLPSHWIERGQTPGVAYSTEEGATSDISEDFSGLDAMSQHSGRVGLGRGGR